MENNEGKQKFKKKATKKKVDKNLLLRKILQIKYQRLKFG